MKSIPFEARTKNIGGGKSFCSWCADTGWVTANLRAAKQSAWARQRNIQPNGWYEEVAPCPYCAKGYALEFPEKSTPVWGVDGYWKHIDEVVLEPMYAPSSKPLSVEENRRRWREEIGPLFGAIGKELAA